MSEQEITLDTGEPKEWKKYNEYKIRVDADQDDKATEIKICSFARPHMRAFHMAWWSYFIEVFTWFSIAPLLSVIRDELGFSKQEIWTSSIVGVMGTIFMRLVMGPVSDKFGARIPMAAVLILTAIPTACTGLIETATGLCVLRLFIGMAGGAFVMCQFWTSRMFVKSVVGTANATVAGWGNLGGGVTQVVMGSLLFPLFKIFYDGDAEKAWRTVCIVPAFVAIVTGICVYKFTDDAPKGNYNELKKFGNMPELSATASFRAGAMNMNTWLCFLQYACCYGVELTMNNATALYFKDEFGQSTESAAALASIFGWMNIFSRSLGGYISDKANAKMGMRGRILLLTVDLVCEAILVMVFAQTKQLGGAIAVLVFLSLFSQGASGATFSMVPYIDPPKTGSISGIVGSGGSVGAVAFGLAFRQLDYKHAFMIMGFSILGCATTTAFLDIKGYARLFSGHDAATVEKDKAVITVPAQEGNVEGEEAPIELMIPSSN